MRRFVELIIQAFKEASAHMSSIWCQHLPGGGGPTLPVSYQTTLTRELTLRVIEKLIATDPHSAVFGAYHASYTAERAACVAQACHVAAKFQIYRARLEEGHYSRRYIGAVEQMKGLQELCEAALGGIAELHARQGRAMMSDEKLIALELMSQRKVAEDAYVKFFPSAPSSGRVRVVDIAGPAAGESQDVSEWWYIQRARNPWPTRAAFDGQCPQEWEEMRRLEVAAETMRRQDRRTEAGQAPGASRRMGGKNPAQGPHFGKGTPLPPGPGRGFPGAPGIKGGKARDLVEVMPNTAIKEQLCNALWVVDEALRAYHDSFAKGKGKPVQEPAAGKGYNRFDCTWPGEPGRRDIAGLLARASGEQPIAPGTSRVLPKAVPPPPPNWRNNPYGAEPMAPTLASAPGYNPTIWADRIQPGSAPVWARQATDGMLPAVFHVKQEPDSDSDL